MSPKDEAIAKAVYQRLIIEAKNLSMVDLMSLRTAGVDFGRLSHSLRNACLSIGLAATSAAALEPKP